MLHFFLMVAAVGMSCPTLILVSNRVRVRAFVHVCIYIKMCETKGREKRACTCGVVGG